MLSAAVPRRIAELDGIPDSDKIPQHSDKGHPVFVPDGLGESDLVNSGFVLRVLDRREPRAPRLQQPSLVPREIP